VGLYHDINYLQVAKQKLLSSILNLRMMLCSIYAGATFVVELLLLGTNVSTNTHQGSDALFEGFSDK
jgi:hypothetical protein